MAAFVRGFLIGGVGYVVLKEGFGLPLFLILPIVLITTTLVEISLVKEGPKA